MNIDRLRGLMALALVCAALIVGMFVGAAGERAKVGTSTHVRTSVTDGVAVVLKVDREGRVICSPQDRQ